MHAEAWAFLAWAAGQIDLPFESSVVEFGSHDVNGNPRSLFRAARYTGVDPWPGPGVDVVGLAQDFDGAGQYDVCITAEALEHDADPVGQIAAAWRALKPGGWLVLTAAAEPRLPHRCDGAQGDTGGEHYANIAPEDLREWLAGWQVVALEHDTQHGDVYALARRL